MFVDNGKTIRCRVCEREWPDTPKDKGEYPKYTDDGVWLDRETFWRKEDLEKAKKVIGIDYGFTPKSKDEKFPIDNNLPYRQVHWLNLSKLADFMGEFTKDDLEHPIWPFFFWLDKKSTKLKTDAYILNPKYEESTPQSEEWEEEFDKYFDGLTIGILTGDRTQPVLQNNEMEVPRLKSFIANLLSLQRQRLEEKVEGIPTETVMSNAGGAWEITAEDMKRAVLQVIREMK